MISSSIAFDAIVVGARCAGAPTAMLLARAGARVLVLDRASFPSDTISGHAIKPPGVARLAKWGLLDTVLATGCPTIADRHVFIAGRQLDVAPVAGSLPMVAPRRTVLDLVLVQAAAAAGADVQERTRVRSVIRDGDRVVGVEARRHTGATIRAIAPLVIGADGKHSEIAQQVGAAYYQYTPPVSIAYYAYWSGCRVDGLGLHLEPGRAAGVFPTNDGQILAFVQRSWSERDVFRADVTRSYLTTLRAFPAVADVLAGGVRESPVRGMVDLPAYFRRSYGRGWALAGDAAHHKDPFAARGISDAFRDAEMLAQAVQAGLGGQADLLRSLARYEMLRDRTSNRISAANQRMAELPDDPDELHRRFVALVDAETDADAELRLSAKAGGVR